MFVYQTPYYNAQRSASAYQPYHQAMFLHYAEPSYNYPTYQARTSGTSAFAAGDTIAAGTFVNKG